MTLLKKIIESRQSAQQKVYEAAKKDAAGKTNGAGAQIQQLLAEAAISDEEFCELVSFFKRVATLEAEAEQLPAVSKAHGEARQAVEQHERETLRIEEKRRTEYFQLTRELAGKRAASRQAHQARYELDALKFQYPERFGAEPVHDLDLVTPCFKGEPLRACDPQAPLVEVDFQTYREQGRRRGNIRANARNKVNVNEGYGTALDWASIIQRGWNVELDQ